MNFFDSSKNVDQYIEMTKGYDGRKLIDILKKHLLKGSTVLELGMGPGIDLDILLENYKATGSDYSQVFLDLYYKKHPKADLLKLDAVTLNTDRKFDCIYSNKVLMHLSREELNLSFQRQRKLLNNEGMLMHSFWYGAKEEEFSGLRFIYYTEQELLKITGPGFKVLENSRYTEIKTDDSFYVLLRKETSQFVGYKKL